jgi:hypothetical protein
MIAQPVAEHNLFNYAPRDVLDFPLNIVEDNKGMFTTDFIAWIPKNLHVFGEFCSRALAIKKSGRTHYGAKTIAEVIRFNTDIRSKPDESFKMNNNYTAYLARLCMLAYPQTNGMFELRETKKVYEKEGVQ